MGFVASCVEAVAKRLGISYKEVYERMKNVSLINNYILPFYDVIHTESRDNVTESIISTLIRWEQEHLTMPRKLKSLPTKNDNQTVKDIILWQHIGCIAVRFAERLGISPEAALDLFYKSETCEKLHDATSGLNLLGDLYIVDEVVMEM